MEKSFDLLLIGHLAQDIILHEGIPDLNTSGISMGGGVTYGSLSGNHHDPENKIGIISKIGTDFDTSLLKIFPAPPIDISNIIIEGDQTTTYELNYTNHSRKIRLVKKAPEIDPLSHSSIIYNTKSMHITPIAGEISLSSLEKLATDDQLKNCLFGLDLQGFIREFDSEGYLSIKDGKKVLERLFPIMEKFGNRLFFKASDEEIQILTKNENLEEATRLLGKSGAYILTTHGGKGLLFKAPEHNLIQINAFKPRATVDETGAGDCFMAVLLLELVKHSHSPLTNEVVIEAIKIASSASSFLVEEKGPKGFQDRNTIIQRLTSQNI
ncbi:MAG: PfkB family carbohydrate kinase [Promethearchaeota archaeon]